MPPIVIPCRQQIIRQNFMINTITQNNMFAKTPLNLINRHRSHHHIPGQPGTQKQRKFTFSETDRTIYRRNAQMPPNTYLYDIGA